MHEFDRELEELRQQLDEIAARGNREPDHEVLARAVDDGTARDQEVLQYAQLLRPHVRAQVLRCADWRTMWRSMGGELDFVPTSAMDVVVEICSYFLEDPLPTGLEHSYELMLKPSWARWKKETNLRWAHHCYLEWVQAQVLLQVTGTTDCHDLREELDRWDEDWTPPGADLLPDSPILELAQPLLRGRRPSGFQLLSSTGIPWP